MKSYGISWGGGGGSSVISNDHKITKVKGTSGDLQSNLLLKARYELSSHQFVQNFVGLLYHEKVPRMEVSHLL